MSRSVRLFAVAVISIGAGALSAVQAIETVPSLLHHSGPWVHVSGAAFESADPYAAARAHLSADRPLGTGEGIVVATETDSDGEPLNAACDYRIAGRIPVARVFTFSVNTLDGEPASMDARLPAALHSDLMIFSSDAYAVDMAPEGRPGNWLATTSLQGNLQLVFRLYETSIAGPSGMESLDLPKITRLACRDA
jgi:hypothetical protein